MQNRSIVRSKVFAPPQARQPEEDVLSEYSVVGLSRPKSAMPSQPSLPPEEQDETKIGDLRIATSSGRVSRRLLMKSRGDGMTMIENSSGDKFKVRRHKDTSWNVNAMRTPFATVPRPLDDKPYVFIQEYDLGSILTTSTALFTATGVQFTLSALPQASALEVLFDQYQIALVEFWVFPNVQEGTTGAMTGPTLYSVLDYDDANSPTNEAYMLEYQNVMATSPLEGHYRSFVPHVAYATFSGAFTSYGNEVAPWIDCASAAVNHYGVKVGCTTTFTSIGFMARARLTVRFRNVR
jgi:hypothetical protein